MSPTFKDGQVVLFFRRRVYRPGDIVLIKHAGLEKVKRISKLQDGKVFLLGDNQTESTDSRHFGPIDNQQLKAKAIIF